MLKTKEKNPTPTADCPSSKMYLLVSSFLSNKNEATAGGACTLM
jgi:hypothetical protein